MGILRDRLSDVRFDRAAWLNDDDGESQPSIAGPAVTSSSALSLSTVWRCVDLISHAVSLAPRDVVVKVGGQSFPEYNLPPWLSTPNPGNPNYTTDDYFAEQVAATLIEGNWFTAVAPHVFDPQVLTAVPPNRVRVKDGPRYEVLDERGRVQRTLTPAQMLHGWWIKLPGELRGVSPLEKLRRTLGGALAADEYAARFFGQGASLAFGVEVPTALSDEQRENLRDSLKRRHQGLGNSHAIGVLTSGAKFVTGLAPSPEQAQMLETRKFSVEDIARVYGVPPGMVGSQEPGASSYASAIEWRKMFRDDALLKFTANLERMHERLLHPPDALPDAAVQLRFNLDWVARADLLQRYQAHEAGVRGGFLTPNEARKLEDLPPHKGGGDQLYMQQQMVPIGTAPTGGVQ
jgi:HK97 family phage portal protein